jgi:thiol-disulfide isomerase/thioredoxin
MRIGRCLVAVSVLAFALVANAARADEPAPEQGRRPAVGEKPPPVAASTWLNTADGKSPGLEGKVVLVEFWGTWCGPCVRAMPHIQDLHERYGPRGVVVVGITREKPDEVKGFLAENKYTMPVGCDPEQTCVNAYRPNGWPSTYVLGKDGLVAFVGKPYGAEAAVEKALGLESDAAALLTAYLDAAKAADAKATRAALERLTEKAYPGFDLKAWALGALGSEPAAPTTPPKVDAAKVLDGILAAWKATDATKRGLALTPVAQNGPTKFDLRAWTLTAFAKAFPLTKDELTAALDGERYGVALDLLLYRNPAAGLLSQAAKHAGFAAWCKAKRDDAKKDARRGLMAIHYVFPGKPLGQMNEEQQKKFWQDLAVSGMVTDEKEKRVIGLLIGGDHVMEDGAPAYVSYQLARYVLMTSLLDGKPLKAAALTAEAKKQEEEIVAELKRTY